MMYRAFVPVAVEISDPTSGSDGRVYVTFPRPSRPRLSFQLVLLRAHEQKSLPMLSQGV